MLSADYKKRLSDWVKSEMERSGLSERALAPRIGVSYGTLGYWRRQQITKELSDSSIHAIARYRCEDPAAVRAWLEGRQQIASNPLIEGINRASLDNLVQALKVGLRRLEGALALMSCNNVSHKIQEAIRSKGLDPSSYEDFREFALHAPLSEPEEFEHLWAIARGETPPDEDDLPDIALAIESFTGKPCTVADLKNPDGNSHHYGTLNCPL